MRPLGEKSQSLVIGASGMVGSHIVRRLFSDGGQPIGLLEASNKMPEQNGLGATSLIRRASRGLKST
ncbi:NAD-dependent epimerase/dehydratase family protein [Bradyrhizobium sp. CCBAU 21362]|uniref:NAD-dependent epimerase/dehydratase family protein n=1 Tax=Bradyrhizobium sp. CCBAU 21362 TaxID=1325082 RepID=UPI003FA491CB